MTHRTAMALACLAAAGGVATAAASQGGSMAPRPALVKAHGLTARSSLGSYCTTSRPHNGTTSSLCADAAFPDPRGRLPVHGGDTIHLRFRHNPAIRDHIKHVRVALARTRPTPVVFIGSVGRPRPLPGHPNRWLATLPEDLGKANAVDISVRYRQGDADFIAGIRPQ